MRLHGTFRRAAAGLVLAVPAICAAQSSEAVVMARSTLDRWVETRQLISKERSDWAAEREAAQATLALLEQEKKDLEQKLIEGSEESTAADRERVRLNDESEQIRASTKNIADVLPALEARVKALVARLPQDLTTRIDPLIRRLPRDSASTRASTSERMQNIVGILSEVERFNGMVTATTSLVETGGGQTAQVKTLYFGLSRAFFIDATNAYAGYLEPGPEGWTQKMDPALAPAIRLAIDIVEANANPAFVDLPFAVR